MTEQVHLIYSGADEAMFASVRCMRSQLHGLANHWLQEPNQLPAMRLIEYNTAKIGWQFHYIQAVKMVSLHAAVLVLLAPDVISTPFLCGGDDLDMVLQGQGEGRVLILPIYCEKLGCRDDLRKRLGYADWVTEEHGLHLGAGPRVNDDCADAAAAIKRSLIARKA